MKVFITTLGRSHFISVASSLVRAGVDVVLHQGWIIADPNKSKVLNLLSQLFKRKSLVYGFTQRLDPSLTGRNVGDFFSEAIQTFLRVLLSRFAKNPIDVSTKIGMHLHGRRGMSLLKRGHFDIVHVRSGYGAGGLIDYAHKHGIKVLVDHSAGSPNFVMENVEEEKLNPKSYWWTVQQDCERADILMCDCEWVKHTFEMYGYPSEKIRVVYMGLDQKFNGLRHWEEDVSGLGRSAEKPCRIVFTGGFAWHKGNEYFLQAVDKLIRVGLHFEFKVIGKADISSAQRNKYSEAISSIKFIGHIPQNEMIAEMISSHIYLFPSLSEGCAKSAYEAMSMGLCVVATKETGLPLKDGESGWLIESRNAEDMVNKILSLVNHPEKIKNTGLAGAEVMKRFTWEYYAENVKKLYSELLAS